MEIDGNAAMMMLLWTMAEIQNQEFDYINHDHFEVAEFDDDDSFEEENQSQRTVEDSGDDNMNEQKTDTSALEARNGRDIQGIPW